MERTFPSLSQRSTRAELSKPAQKVLMNYNWPGNIRELSNIVERIYYMSETDTIEVHDIPSQIITDHVHANQKKVSSNGSLDDILSRLERDIVLTTLEKTHNNVSQTAATLQIPRSRLYRILKRQDIHTNSTE